MKIRKLHIKNYKVFDDLELDFTDAQGNTLDKVVLAGVNGCGKTTVLEIIFSIFNGGISFKSLENQNSLIGVELELTIEEKKYLQEVMYNYLNGYEKHRSDDDLKHYEKLTKIQSQFEKDKLHFSIRFESVTLFEAILISSWLSHADKLAIKPLILTYLPVNERKVFLFETIKFIHINTSKDEMKKLALKDIRDEVFKNEDITIRESKEKAIKRLQKPLNGLELTTNLTDLESEELIFESPNGKRIKFEELSNGEQNLYFRAIYLSILNPQNSIIMIDEPEESLHPTWQQKVLQLYQNIGENNQVIVATHSPHIIGACKAEEVFLLQIDENHVKAAHPKYTKGHSIEYILEEMGADPNDTAVISLMDSYLALVRKGLHETEQGLRVKAAIDALELDPNSHEMRRLDLSMRRIKVIGV